MIMQQSADAQGSHEGAHADLEYTFRGVMQKRPFSGLDAMAHRPTRAWLVDIFCFGRWACLDSPLDSKLP